MRTDLRFAQAAVHRPHRCAIVPFIGQTHPEGFIDTGTDYWGERVYLSVVGVKECAKLIGWVPKQQLQRAVRDVNTERERVVELEAERDALQARLDAIDVIESEGFRARKKTGRPKQEVVA